MEQLALGLALAGVILTRGRVGQVSSRDRLGVALVLVSAAWCTGFLVVSS